MQCSERLEELQGPCRGATVRRHLEGEQPRAVERRPAPESSSADEESELTRLRAYKAEMESDAGRLRDELGAAQREIGKLTAALAKANARAEYLTGEWSWL